MTESYDYVASKKSCSSPVSSPRLSKRRMKNNSKASIGISNDCPLDEQLSSIEKHTDENYTDSTNTVSYCQSSQTSIKAQNSKNTKPLRKNRNCCNIM